MHRAKQNQKQNRFTPASSKLSSMAKRRAVYDEFDQVFDDTGHFGRYQWFLWTVISSVILLPGIHNNASVFLQRLPTQIQCADLNADNQTQVPSQFQEILKFNSQCGTNSSDYCQVRNLQSGLNQTCSNFTYYTDDFGTSARADFNLICEDQTLNTIATVLYFFGVLLGASLGGYLADNYGRKFATVLGIGIITLAGAVPYFVQNYTVYTVARFIVGVGVNASYVPAFTLLLEFIGPRKVTIPGIWCHGFFAAGACLLAVFAYFFRTWQRLQLVSTLFGLPIAVIFWFLSEESPKYLISKNKYSAAARILTKVARINRSDKSIDITAESLRGINEKGFRKAEESKETSKFLAGDEKEREVSLSSNSSHDLSATYTIKDLFRSKSMGSVTLNLMLQWYCCSLMFYGLGLNAAALPLAPWFNVALLNFIEIPAYLYYFLEYAIPGSTKRRPVLAISLMISGVCCLVSTVFAEISKCDKGSDDQFSNPFIVGGVVLVMIGKMSCCVAFGLIYLYTAECYPVMIRSTGVGIGSLSARFASMCTPLVLALYVVKSWLPGAVLGVSALLSGLVAFKLPETYGKSMPTTFSDAERLYKDRT